MGNRWPDSDWSGHGLHWREHTDTLHDAGSSHSWSRPGRGAAREPSVAPAVLSMQPVTPPRLKKRKTEHPHPMHNRIWYINIYTVGIEAALGNATPHTREALLDHIRRE